MTFYTKKSKKTPIVKNHPFLEGLNTIVLHLFSPFLIFGNTYKHFLKNCLTFAAKEVAL